MQLLLSESDAATAALLSVGKGNASTKQTAPAHVCEECGKVRVPPLPACDVIAPAVSFHDIHLLPGVGYCGGLVGVW